MDSKPAPGLWMEAGREDGLALSAKGGDLSALAELLGHYHPTLWRLCFAFTADPIEAELLSEETARHALREIGGLRIGNRVFPWLVRIACTLALRHAPPDGGDGIATAPTRPNGEPWEPAPRSPRDVPYEQHVLAAFLAFAPDERAMLALRLFERLSYADVAAVLGLTSATVAQRLTALRERLDHELERREKAA
jgi:RNA polymerase sigma-70 factor (ECF subfamily)